MNLTVISASIAAVVGFGSAWQIQTYRNLDEQNNRITQQIEEERELSRMESQRSAQVLSAQNNARSRESKLRMDAAAAQFSANSLRSALINTVQAARSDPLTCPDAAATLGTVLADSSQAYTELAAICDRHVSDITTLIESSPR